jgi:hypothetical protein
MIEGSQERQKGHLGTVVSFPSRTSSLFLWRVCVCMFVCVCGMCSCVCVRAWWGRPVVAQQPRHGPYHVLRGVRRPRHVLQHHRQPHVSVRPLGALRPHHQLRVLRHGVGHVRLQRVRQQLLRQRLPAVPGGEQPGLRRPWHLLRRPDRQRHLQMRPQLRGGPVRLVRPGFLRALMPAVPQL